MNTTQLTCFLAVAETLSFATAARQLNITQPAVSHQIQTLEEELNTRLFKRTTRTVGLTPEGQLFLNDAKHILYLTALAKKRLETPQVEERKIFSIGCRSQSDPDLLAPILRKMRETVPSLYPVFQVVPFQHIYQLLEDETVDVVVSFQEKSWKKPAGIYKELTQIHLAGVVPAEHPLAQKELLHRDDLRTERLILIDPLCCPDYLNEAQREAAKERTMSELLLCHSAGVCAALVKAGFGIAVLPKLPNLHDPELAFLPLAEVRPLSYGAYYKRAEGKPLLRLFLQLCREHFSADQEQTGEGRDMQGDG